MNSPAEELKINVRRNMLLGLWAAEKLGLTGREAEAYAEDLAIGTLDAERSDVFNRIRKDFNGAGVVQSDEQILRVMESFMLQASAGVRTARAGSVDAAEVALKRKLTSR
jgi:hypothetical protein